MIHRIHVESRHETGDPIIILKSIIKDLCKLGKPVGDNVGRVSSGGRRTYIISMINIL